MTFIHPTAEVSPEAIIGNGTKIWNQAQIREKAVIGSNCNLGKDVYIDKEVVVGDNCKIQNFTTIYKGVVLEDNIFLGPGVCFTNDKLPRTFRWSDDQITPTKVKSGASIGAGSVIVCGLTIGRYAMIGAGSVVTRSIPDHALAYGNPARIQGFVCRCGQKLTNWKKTGETTTSRCDHCQQLISLKSSSSAPERTSHA